MGNKDWIQFGPWVPYPRPVPLPETDIADPPLLGICVNESWVPYISGALKVLLKDVTWDSIYSGDITDVERQVSDLLASWSDCPMLPEGIDWYFHATGGGLYSITNFGFMEDGTCMGVLTADLYTPIELMGTEIGSSNVAGGDIENFTVYSLGVPALMTVTAYDCDDNITFSQSGSYAVFHDYDLWGSNPFNAHRLEIMSNDNELVVHIQWKNAATCGVA